MQPTKRWHNVTRTLLAFAAGGCLMQLNCVGKVAKNFNPCGTLINCDPLEYDLLWVEDYPDWETDPTCTIPGLCEGAFPIGEAGAGAVGAAGE